MADTWPIDDPSEDDGGGFLSGFLGAIGKGASSGFGMGDASSGMAGGTAVETPPLLDKLYQGATDMTLGQYPGYGNLWTYDTRDGVEVTQQGWVILGAAGVVLYFVLFSGGR